MNDIVIYSCIVLFSVFVSAIGQVLLKKSAKKTFENKFKEYFNPYVITGYIIYILTFLVTTYCLKVIPLSMMPILDSCGYIFVAIFSYIIFKEKYTKIQMAGIICIILGVVIYSINVF